MRPSYFAFSFVGIALFWLTACGVSGSGLAMSADPSETDGAASGGTAEGGPAGRGMGALGGSGGTGGASPSDAGGGRGGAAGAIDASVDQGQAGSGGSGGAAGSGGSGGAAGSGGSGGAAGSGGKGGKGGTGGAAGTGGTAGADAGGGGGTPGTDAAVKPDVTISDVTLSVDASPAPTPGKIACGTSNCDLEKDVCCVTATGGACQAKAISCAAGAVQRCDGPEDCSGGRICCARQANVGGYLSACTSASTCSDGEGSVVCRVTEDCSREGPGGQRTCVPSDFGPHICVSR